MLFGLRVLEMNLVLQEHPRLHLLRHQFAFFLAVYSKHLLLILIILVSGGIELIK
jgi:hypothetical protein